MSEVSSEPPLDGGQTILDDVLPEGTRDGNFLITGPILSGRQAAAYEILAVADAVGGQPFCVTTKDSAATIRDTFETYRTAGDDGHELLVIEATGNSTERTAIDEHTVSVSSPADLTGIGIAVTEALASLPEAQRDGARVYVNNLSTLLMYSDFKRVYRFVHSLNHHLGDVNGSSIQMISDAALDKHDAKALFQLFDTIVQFRAGDEGLPEFRLRGNNRSDWHSFGEE
jgi:KaiC/GvpD/RAD55 family RecA-like ATPase